MRDAITNYLPWLMSAITITAIELQGRKWPRAWALSLGGQVFWFIWIAAAWDGPGKGFLPMTAILCFQYLRNHLSWMRQREAGPAIEAKLPNKCAACVTPHVCERDARCIRLKPRKFPPPPPGWSQFIRGAGGR